MLINERETTYGLAQRRLMDKIKLSSECGKTPAKPAGYVTAERWDILDQDGKVVCYHDTDSMSQDCADSHQDTAYEQHSGNTYTVQRRTS